eukprot:CAMPEP_0184700256 /NCGR_PEP_ID=MMETSP0313-20130426/10947_1 /TAXON_ID=2792 /ORGANISM="Porphyridium aerugineum, Strain SAG 1380-2" /LENGTH=79 /DNA_ID=CAMNT_0027159825 /DNA_START=431 /DNA_END=670 /DNA_ORIENTATION=+
MKVDNTQHSDSDESDFEYQPCRKSLEFGGETAGQARRAEPAHGDQQDKNNDKKDGKTSTQNQASVGIKGKIKSAFSKKK